MRFEGKKIALAISGGIAAFKAVTLCRLLLKEGAEVQVLMTPHAKDFVGVTTFSALTRKKVIEDMWDPQFVGEVHVDIADWADFLVIAPSTMSLIGKMASGICDNSVLATAACMEKPVFLAPAMHTKMWFAPAMQRNIKQLKEDGIHILEPVEGLLANGAFGMGRMMEPEDIVKALCAYEKKKPLDGKRLLITAGPTVENIDPVRFISNASSGKMGRALVQKALEWGAKVTLIHGPLLVQIESHPCLQKFSIRSAMELNQYVQDQLLNHDVLIMAAAVADFRPEKQQSQKIKKSENVLEIKLIKNPDILSEASQKRGNYAKPILVGFALETQNIEDNAKQKLLKKGLDCVVANFAHDSIGQDTNKVAFVSSEKTEWLATQSKEKIAEEILIRVAHKI